MGTAVDFYRRLACVPGVSESQHADSNSPLEPGFKTANGSRTNMYLWPRYLFGAYSGSVAISFPFATLVEKKKKKPKTKHDDARAASPFVTLASPRPPLCSCVLIGMRDEPPRGSNTSPLFMGGGHLIARLADQKMLLIGRGSGGWSDKWSCL